MKATLSAKQTSNAVNHNGKKELLSRFVVVTKTTAGEYLELIDCRVYASYHADGAAPLYASIWIRGPQDQAYYSGTGRANGYGYHKGSAAIAAAIESAGIKLDTYIDGRGYSAVRDALKAICEAIGYTDIHIVE